LLISAGAAQAQLTQAYSFESGLEGFVVNGGGLTISHNTNAAFASEGSGSMQLAFADFSSFAGGVTSMLHPAINDPPGVDVVVFDLINTNRFVPPEPVAGQDPTFANTSISMFGEFASNPGVTEHIQYFFSEEPIGNLDPGIHEVVIDVTSGGLLIGSSDIKGFNEWIASGFIPASFQIYINKSFGFGRPAFAWTVYIDNIRVGTIPPPLDGDYNDDGKVDAADYVMWRKNEGTMNMLPNDPHGGTIGPDQFNTWRTNFGMMNGAGSGAGLTGGAVPEPAGASLAVLAAVCWCVAARRRVLLEGV
jgi:hypothetical protein